MRIAKTIVVPALALFAVVASAQPRVERSAERRDPLPLRNWVAPITMLAGTIEGEVGALAVPTGQTSFVGIAPCRIVDTRDAPGSYGGPKLSQGETRTFDLDDGPCPRVPAGAIAYSVSFGVTETVGNGAFLTAWPTGESQPGVATITWNEGLTLTTGAILPAGTAGAIDVFAGNETHLTIDVNGYFVEAGGSRTILVSPVEGGTEADNGAALLNALNGITGNGPNSPWLIKLAPGVYGVGGNPVQMKEHVDIEGSGRNVTRIVSNRTSTTSDTGAIIAVNNVELRGLTVERNGGTGSSYGFAIYVSGVSPRLTDLTITATDAPFSMGIYTAAGAAPVVTDCTISATYAIATMNAAVWNNGASPAIVHSTLAASGSSASSNRGFLNSGTGSPSLIDSRVTAATSGAGSSPAVYNSASSGVLLIRQSVLSGTSYGIHNFSTGTVRVITTQLGATPLNNSGGGTVSCLGSYNASFAPLSSTCS